MSISELDDLCGPGAVSLKCPRCEWWAFYQRDGVTDAELATAERECNGCRNHPGERCELHATGHDAEGRPTWFHCFRCYQCSAEFCGSAGLA